ncbi:DUF3159 domain-containing protein [Sphaerisporangium siamense]|uniref:Putative membrane protein n=1 Tax=Sphaerisporangium siamense TaxID=795645 RepID=A0A7W7D9G5_9ACTN|nr:DUF3159 domain-containing protein [Sphaerisporangium siamense]MBB4702707.1 putative membrane protein [Sphaerisporangium siamense]
MTMDRDGARTSDETPAPAGEGHGAAPAGVAEAAAGEQAAHDTVEAAIRAQLAKALGGVRGIIEAAVPTVAFTITWITSEQLKLSLIVGIGAAVLLLVVRLAQRSTVQFVLNSLIGIGVGAFFASKSGEAKDVFLPGIWYNAAYAVAMTFSVVVRWPVVGFLIGSVTGDPTGWRRDPGVVRLCSRLTWLLILPCVLRVVVQLPLYYADQVAALGVAKVALGWPLQVAGLAAMVWVLARGRTPITGPSAPGA